MRFVSAQETHSGDPAAFRRAMENARPVASGPRDVPALRRAYADWLGTSFSRAVIYGYLDAGRWICEGGSLDEQYSYTVNRLTAGVVTSEMFYITPEMLDVAQAAAVNLPDWAINPEDLPSPSGFVVLGRPLPPNMNDELGGMAAVVAASWSLWSASEPGPGVYVQWFTNREDALLALPAPERERTRTVLPPLMPEHEILLRFGRSSASLRNDWQWPAIGMLLAAWRLMQQPAMVTSRRETPDRAERRRLARAGLAVDDVTVVTLRTARNEGSTNVEPHRDRDHRWLVRGHWRQQWYPSRNDHAPVFISGYVKGPADKPLMIRDKVSVWSR